MVLSYRMTGRSIDISPMRSVSIISFTDGLPVMGSSMPIPRDPFSALTMFNGITVLVSREVPPVSCVKLILTGTLSVTLSSLFNRYR